MPKRGTSPYTYRPGDDPVKVAARYNITPQQLIDANPGAWPASTGQQINLPSFNLDKYRNTFQQGAQYGPVGALYGATNAASQIGSDILGGTSIAANNLYRDVRSGSQGYQAAYRRAATPGNIQALGLVAPGVANSLLNSQAGAGGLGGVTSQAPTPITGSYYQSEKGVSQYQAPVRRGGSNDAAAMAQLNEQYLNNPDSVSPADQQKLMDYLNQRAGNPTGTVTNSAGTGSDEFMNTGFMQQNAANGTAFTDQLRWDGKKYVKIGKLIKQGRLDVRSNGRFLKNRRNSGGGGNNNQARVDPNGRLAGVGLVNFNVGSG